MVCLKLNWFFCCLSRMLNFSKFVWTVSYSVWDVFNKFLLIDTTDRSNISSDQKRFFIALSLYPLSFFANTPFNMSPFHSNIFRAQTFYSLWPMRLGTALVFSIHPTLELWWDLTIRYRVTLMASQTTAQMF